MTNMTLWSQGCSDLVKLLHGCDEEACDKVAGTPQPCHFCMGCISEAAEDGYQITAEYVLI